MTTPQPPDAEVIEKKSHCRIKDISGNRVGRLCVVKYSHSRKARTYWVCKCDCGTVKTIAKNNLGRTFSCGCARRDRMRGNRMRRVHGCSPKSGYTKLYGVWRGMIKRCENPNCELFEWWGAKGIKICQKWRKSFVEFQKWAIGSGYKQGLTIERKNPFGNYEPRNCTWATQQQGHNKRINYAKLK